MCASRGALHLSHRRIDKLGALSIFYATIMPARLVWRCTRSRPGLRNTREWDTVARCERTADHSCATAQTQWIRHNTQSCNCSVHTQPHTTARTTITCLLLSVVFVTCSLALHLFRTLTFSFLDTFVRVASLLQLHVGHFHRHECLIKLLQSENSCPSTEHALEVTSVRELQE
jgi:hypothetical protein